MSDFRTAYRDALATWLADPTEAVLREAYRLGRRGRREEVSLLELAWTHHEALAAIDPGEGSPGDRLEEAAAFLLECLAPYEMARRGHREALDSLREARERFTEAQRTAHIGTWTWVVGSDRVRASEELRRIYGFEEDTDELPFEAFKERVHPDDRERVRQIGEDALDGAGSFGFEHRILLPDGSTRSLRSTLEVDVEDGEVVRMRGTGQDITEWKDLQRKYHQAQKMEVVGRLAGGVAHDFNNLVTGILLSCDNLGRKLPAEHGGQAYVRDMSEAARKASGLIQQLLAFGRRQVLQPEPVDPNRAIEELERLLARLIGDDVRIAMDLDPHAGHVRVDPTRFEQVLLNLAINARDAMPEGGELRIRTRARRIGRLETVSRRLDLEPGPYVAVLVEDTGLGMDQETRSRIFEPFYSTKEEDQGTGLGLATVYGIVTQSEGEIVVSSAPDRGTTFTVLLPRHEPEAPEDVPRETPTRPPDAEERTARVLLVEDDDLVRSGVRETLEEAGHEVVVATTGDEGWERLVESNGGQWYDLLVTDLLLPGHGGRSLARRFLRVRPEGHVVFMTGHAEVEDPGELEGPLLVKPFPPEDLLRTMDDLLGG